MRHCITLDDFSADEIRRIVMLAVEIKNNPGKFKHSAQGKWLLLLFQKTSTRTRLSFEIGMGKLGGHSVVMDWDSSNFSISPLEHEARYASSQVDLIMARLKSHQDILKLAEHSTVPVINGCDEKYHPCQALADLMTVYEQEETFQGQSIAYVGIHNNVANSLACSATKLGVQLYLVTPEVHSAAYDPELMERLTSTGYIERTLKLREAALAAKFVYTDTWVDMEHFNNPEYEAEKQRRIALMSPYQLNSEVMKGSSARILHDMPIHPGYEIAEELVHDPRSLIFQQAANRMYVQQALIMVLLEFANEEA